MRELESYVKYLDSRIGCSNDYHGMFEEGYEIDAIVSIIMESLHEMYQDTKDVEVLEWIQGLNNKYAILEVY